MSGTSTVDTHSAVTEPGTADPPTKKAPHSRWTPLLSVAALFVLALSLRLWFCFLDNHLNSFVCFDGAGYLAAAQAISNQPNLASVLGEGLMAFVGLAPAQVLDAVHVKCEPLSALCLAGPVYPLFILLSFALFNLPVDIANWCPTVALQCVISAITCLIVARIGQLAWNRNVGMAAGVFCAVYPPFIINCGRAITETLACLLMTGLVCLCGEVALKSNPDLKGAEIWKIVAAGAVAVLLQLTRSVMSILSFVFIPLFLFQLPNKRKVFAAFVLGLALIIVPWLCFQKIAFGQGALIVDRQGRLNFGIGNRLESQGWAGFPVPYEPIMEKSFLQQSRKLVSTNPGGLLWLTLDKLPRMFEFTWNDFRTRLGPLDVVGQIIFHQLLLALACVGLVLSLARETLLPQKRLILLILSVVLIHLVYAPFVALSRYNLTMMPFVSLFAAAAVVYLLSALIGGGAKRLLSGVVLTLALLAPWILRLDLTPLVMLNSGSGAIWTGLCLNAVIKLSFLVASALALLKLIPLLRKATETPSKLNGRVPRMALAALVTLLLVVVPSICLPIRAHGRWYEKTVTLNHVGDKVSHDLVLPAETLRALGGRDCYLMVDSRGALPLMEGLSISINGKKVEATAMPLMVFADTLNSFERRGEDTLTHISECIFDSFTIAAGMHNLELRQWFLIPLSLDKEMIAQCGNGKLKLPIELVSNCNRPIELFGSYDTGKDVLQLPSWQYHSWDKAYCGVETDRHVSDPRTDSSIASAQGDGRMFVRLLVPPENEEEGQRKLLSTQTLAPITLGEKEKRSILISALPPCKESQIWMLRLSGKFRAVNGQPTQPGINLVFESIDHEGKKFHYDSPWSPKLLKSTADWQHFDVSLPVKPHSYPGTLKDIKVNFAGRSTIYDALTHPEAATEFSGNSSEFSDLQIRIYSLPAVPIADGHRVL